MSVAHTENQYMHDQLILKVHHVQLPKTIQPAYSIGIASAKGIVIRILSQVSMTTHTIKVHSLQPSCKHPSKRLHASSIK
jgi:hypothetical protein